MPSSVIAGLVMVGGVARSSPACPAEAFDAKVGLEGFCQSEVEHLDRAVRPDLDVGRLQIPMDDAPLVRGLEGVGDLPRDGEGV